MEDSQDAASGLQLERFTDGHLPKAIELWNSTEHIGVGASDAIPDLQAFLERNADYCFVVERAQQVAGTVLAGHDQRRGYVYHLATAGSARREGIATQLLDSALASLRTAGVRKCHAFVFRSNPYAELFWKKLGWEQRDDLIVFSRTL